MPIKESIYLPPAITCTKTMRKKQVNINEKAIRNDTAHNVNRDLLI